MLDVREVVIAVDVDSMDLNLVARAGYIDQIVKDKDFFLAGNTAGWHSAWRLLDGQLLVVAVDSLDVVDSVGTIGMADNALSERLACLVRVSVIDGALHIATLAPEVHLSILREHLSALRDDTLEFNQGI